MKPGDKGKLALEVIGSRPFVDVTVPRTGIPGKLRMLTQAEMKGLRAACRRATAHLNLKSPDLEVSREWQEEIITQTVAIAVRDPDDPSKPLAQLAEWEECGQDQIALLYQQYEDHCNAIDPLAQPHTLTDGELIEMKAAAKKKHVGLLTSYGSLKLAAFAITTASPPAS